jgi:hypothetical protein
LEESPSLGHQIVSTNRIAGAGGVEAPFEPLAGLLLEVRDEVLPASALRLFGKVMDGPAV